jgi:phenylalanyl-tRNA synthetase alpha chain
MQPGGECLAWLRPTYEGERSVSQDSGIDLASLHALEIRTLRAYEGNETDVLTDAALPQAAGIGPGQIRRAVEWLISKELLSVAGEETVASVSLTEAGEHQADVGATPEVALLMAVAEGSAQTLKALQSDDRFDPGEWGSAFGGLKQEGVIDLQQGAISVVDAARAAFYTERLVPELLGRLREAGQDATVDLSEFSEEIQSYIQEKTTKRGKGRAPIHLDERAVRSYGLTDSGVQTLREVVAADLAGEEVSRLTPEMIQGGGWRGTEFRRYDLSIKPPRIQPGRLHPYRAFLDGVRRKLMALGFEEMKGSLVETEFWNMDALFMPQYHAARNIHDAYYLKEPERSKEPEEPYFSRVGQAHTDGGDTGSRGWRYPFDPARSQRLLLRTQGTALSARTLANTPNIPGKYFAIARCFRPDDVDATHAADFIQVEGIVLGSDINFRSLLGLLKLFALEIAQSEDVRYVPDYFPFTEPSVELQAKHPTRGWIEIGGSGLFRPELTHPLGVDVPVIAWGLGVDRMAMVALGIDDIRDLFSQDLDFVRNKR